MLIGIENIIHWLESNKGCYWKIKSGGGEKSYLLYTSGKEDASAALEDSKKKLRDSLGRLANGNYFIQCWETLGAKKNWASTYFQITASTEAPQNYAGINGPQNNNVDVAAAIAQALAEYDTKNKVIRLENDLNVANARIKQLEAELDSSGHRISGRIEQVMALLDMAPAAKKATPAIGGSEEEIAERVGNLMERWATKDPQFETALTGIVKLAENNEAKYNMAKNML